MLRPPALPLLLALAVAAASGATSRAEVVARWSTATVDGEKLEFYQAHDDAVSGRRPGVLLFHTNLDGVNDYVQLQARKLAKAGYVVLAPKLAAADDFGGNKDATNLTREQRAKLPQLTARRAAAALRSLRGDALVAPDRVAAVGYCHLGGPAAMDLARQGAELSGVAVLWGGVSPGDLSPLWGRRRLKPKILVLLGGSDVETNPYLSSFQEEMRSSRADWRLVLYGRASHAFTMPDPHPDNRGEYDPEADRRSWRELTLFLEDIFQPPSVKSG